MIVLARNVFQNLGDEALLRCELAHLRRALPDQEVVVLTDDPESVGERYGVTAHLSDVALLHGFAAPAARFARRRGARAASHQAGRPLLRAGAAIAGGGLGARARVLEWNAGRHARRLRVVGAGNLSRLLTVLSSASLVVGGGGLIPAVVPVYRARTALYRSIARLGIPLVLTGQTVLPDARETEIWSHAHVVTRDHSVSPANALALGCDPRRLLLGVDPAFSLEPVPAEAALRALAEAGLPSGTPFVAVNLRSWRGCDDVGATRVLAQGLRHSPHAVVIFGMQRYAFDDDEPLLRRLAGRLRADGAEVYELNAHDPAELKGVLALAEIVVSSRYHGALFALVGGVPTVGLSVSPTYDVKLGGLFDLFGVQGQLASLRAGGDELAVKIRTAFERRTSISEQLRRRTEELGPLERIPYDLCRALLSERDRAAAAAVA